MTRAPLINLRLHPAALSRLDQLAAEHGYSRSAAIRQALAHWSAYHELSPYRQKKVQALMGSSAEPPPARAEPQTAADTPFEAALKTEDPEWAEFQRLARELGVDEQEPDF